MPHISAIVATYNRLNLLKLCLRALERQTFKNFEVIVVDDGSNDGTEDFMKDFLLNTSLRCIYCWQEDKGYRLAAARNIGIKFSNGHFLVFLDADMIANPNLLDGYWKAFTQDPKGVFWGDILYIRSENIGKIEYNNIDNFNVDFFRSLSRANDPRDEVNLPEYEKVWGGNFGINKKIITKIGGFDEDFKDWGGEDGDLVCRLVRLGCKIKRLHGCFAFHLGDNFQPVDTLWKFGGVRLFHKEKKHDPRIFRNIRNNKEKCIVKVIFDRSKYNNLLI